MGSRLGYEGGAFLFDLHCLAVCLLGPYPNALTGVVAVALEARGNRRGLYNRTMNISLQGTIAIVDKQPDHCPICQKGIHPMNTETFGLHGTESEMELERVFRCPRKECERIFVCATHRETGWSKL